MIKQAQNIRKSWKYKGFRGGVDCSTINHLSNTWYSVIIVCCAFHCCVNTGHRRMKSKWCKDWSWRMRITTLQTLPTVTPLSRSSSRSFTALKIAHSAQGGGPALNRERIGIGIVDVDTHKNIKNQFLKRFYIQVLREGLKRVWNFHNWGVTPVPHFFGCESSPISRNVRSLVSQSVSQSVSPQMHKKA